MSSTPDKGDSVIAVSAAMLAIMAVAIAIRIYTRLFIVKWVGFDDTLILVAASFAAVEGVTAAMGIKYGLGRHYQLQKKEWLEPYMKLTLASSMSYSAAAMFIKLSLLAFYLRLSPNRTFRVIVYVMMFVSIAFGLASILSAALQCVPITMLWDTNVKGSCINVNYFYFANAALNIFTDTVIYCLPIPTLWKLQLPTVQRLGLCAVLGLGGLVVIASIYRITAIRDLLGSPDGTWNLVSPLNWSTIELDIAIFATCVPAFKAFMRYHLPSWLGTSRNGAYGNSTRNGKTARSHSIPLGSVVHSEHHTNSHGHHFQTHGNKTTTTITGEGNFHFKGRNDSEEAMVLPKQGIMQHTSVRVDHEDDADNHRTKSGTSSAGSLDLKRNSGDQV